MCSLGYFYAFLLSTAGVGGLELDLEQLYFLAISVRAFEKPRGF
jgi:hypothetical protein